MSVRPVVRKQQIGPHWTDFYETGYIEVYFEYMST